MFSVFEKIYRAYLFQIGLEIMWLLHKSTGFSSFDLANVMTLLSLPRWNQLLEYFGRP